MKKHPRLMLVFFALLALLFILVLVPLSPFLCVFLGLFLYHKRKILQINNEHQLKRIELLHKRGILPKKKNG